MPDTEILIDAWPGETRVAALQGGTLQDLWIERPGDRSLVGDIYLGRVSGVAKGIGAVFVDIGTGARPGFLGNADAPGETFTEGQSVIVQVLRDAVSDEGGDKGAKLTRRLGLSGRFVLLTPGDGMVRVSSKIKDKDRQAAWQALLTPLRPDDDTGFVVRTAALEADDNALADEARALAAQWAEISHLAGEGKAPMKVYDSGGAAGRALRDHPDAEVRIGGPAALALKAQLGLAHADAVPGGDLFRERGLDDEIEALLAPAVPLPGGGSVTIQETAAVIAIDVNTGPRRDGSAEQTALAANLETVPVIARQIRLRGLGGLFVIDFAPMKNSDNKARVIKALRRAVAGDPLGVHVAGFTTYGLVEVTRRRQGLPLGARLTVSAPKRLSALTTAFAALRACAGGGPTGRAPALRVSPAVAAALADGPVAQALAALEERLGMSVVLQEDGAIPEDEYEVIQNHEPEP